MKFIQPTAQNSKILKFTIIYDQKNSDIITSEKLKLSQFSQFILRND